MKLVVLLVNREVQGLSVRWVNIYVEICILHVDSHKPHSLLKGGDYGQQCNHPEFQLPNKNVRLLKVQDGSPLSILLGIRKYGEWSRTLSLGTEAGCLLSPPPPV